MYYHRVIKFTLGRNQLCRVWVLFFVSLVSGCGSENEGVISDEATARPLALVIGINAYATSSDSWPDLRTPLTDARSVRTVLQRHYGFEVDEVLDEAATRAGLVKALQKVCSRENVEGLLIYYAGHGFYDEALDRGYWIPFGGMAPKRWVAAVGWDMMRCVEIVGRSTIPHICITQIHALLEICLRVPPLIGSIKTPIGLR